MLVQNCRQRSEFYKNAQSIFFEPRDKPEAASPAYDKIGVQNSVAQLAEQIPVKNKVRGSSPREQRAIGTYGIQPLYSLNNRGFPTKDCHILPP